MLAVFALPLFLAIIQASPVPAPAATSAPNYPEIGRTHSTARACAVIRDLAGPAFVAARKADQRFSTISTTLPRYSQFADEKTNQFGPERTMLITRIDIDLTSMMEDAQVLKKALADPRVGPTVPDPVVQEERAEMQKLYEAETARAGPLFEFVTRERLALLQHDDGDPNAFSRGAGSPTTPPTVAPIPTTTPLWLPQLTGIELTDNDAMRNWTRLIGSSVASSESEAARLFYNVYKGCPTPPPVQPSPAASGHN
jgi:hypothetical protein